ncbi:MAG: sulfotransferase [Coleofasciculus sp. B1-GNL1-01]|uniref:sulfotransferase family protein n=1 Tax=Coleofasciculus sp. B1-GNL1-01 TaxID=3068484 RepID=UPI003302D7C4
MLKQRTGNLPNLIVIGTQKGGTSSLHYYLSLHPQIYMCREKELDFFIAQRNWERGVEWYKKNFVGEAKIYGESSPNYTDYPRYAQVPKRMHSIVPEVKIVYILRDPIKRIISHYMHWYSAGLENRSLSDALRNIESSRYTRRCLYYMQLEQYLNYFAKSNIFIMTSEDLYNKPQKIMQKLFTFLEVDNSFYDHKLSRIHHNSSNKRRNNALGKSLEKSPLGETIEHLPRPIREKAKTLLYFPFSQKVQRPTLDKTLEAELIDYLRPDINRLRDYTGLAFEDWCL